MVDRPAASGLLAVLEAELDAGEAAAIAVAVEQQARQLLTDDRAGRIAARRLDRAAARSPLNLAR